jgi:amidase
MSKLPADFCFAFAVAITRAIGERSVSCTQIMEAHLARIEAVNPKLNAVVALDGERALKEARCLDAQLARGELAGPLHGLPITIQDSLDTLDLVTTGGTCGRRGYLRPKDATVVARLRAAGAIVVGKTNTPELTLGDVTDNDV